MALINCPDCGNKVSDLAPACPKCARPIHAPAHTAGYAPPKTQTVEQTGKLWKGLRLLGPIMAIVSVIASPLLGSFGTVTLLLLGLGAWIMGKIGSWWYHA